MSKSLTRRFLKNKLAFFGLISIFILILIALFGYVLAPDKSINANTQNISFKLKEPGYSFYYLGPKKPENSNFSIKSIFFGSESKMRKTYIQSNFKVKKDSLTFLPMNQSEWKTILIDTFKVETQTYYLGSDGLGRDVLSRLIIGCRVSMLVGLISVFISLIIGTCLGLLSGFFGGWVDKLISWLIQVFWAIPTVLLAMALLAGYRGENQYQILIVFLAVGLTMWVDTARLIRGLVLQLREREFIQAATALSFSKSRIIFRHILPNTYSTLIVITASNFASAILMESGLSYLGLGVQPPTPSWGSMLREYYAYLGTEVSYLAIFPGLCIMLAVFSFYILGNGLRDFFDKKLV